MLSKSSLGLPPPRRPSPLLSMVELLLLLIASGSGIVYLVTRLFHH